MSAHCPACGQEPEPCRFCGCTPLVGGPLGPHGVHRAGCVGSHMRLLAADVVGLGHCGDDYDTFVLLSQRIACRLRQVVAMWPRERMGDVPEVLLNLGDMCEDVVREAKGAAN